MRTMRDLSPLVVLAALILIYATTFIVLALDRHAAFQSHAFDLGNMDQAEWNTSHGHLLRFTDMDVGGHVLLSRLAIHVEPLLIPLSVLYFLHSGPETLLVVQVVVVALGGVPAYLLARDLLGSRWWALVFPAAYLLHPSLQNAVLDDFHAVTMSAAFLLWAMLFAWRRALGGFTVCALLAASTKEEAALLAGALGIILLLRGRRWAGIVAGVLGVVWFVVAVSVIIPAFNPSGHSPYLGRYAYLGHGLPAVLLSPLERPGLVVHTLIEPNRLAYLTDLLHPTGYVALLAFPVLLLSLPALLVNLLSADPSMYSGYYQYSAEIVPYAIAAAIGGVAVVNRVAGKCRTRWGAAIVPALCLFMLLASGVDSWRWGFSPLARGYIIPGAGAHQILEQTLLRSIPRRAVVAAADEIEPHLADRQWIYLLPTVHPGNGPAARYIVLDASIPSQPITPRVLHGVFERALEQGYGVESARDGVLILRAGAHRRILPTSFFSWVYRSSEHVNAASERWGGLLLRRFVIYPRDGFVNRARPAIGIDTFWRRSRHFSSGTRISLYLSPVYTGAHPAFSSRWQRQDDSPTWDWLPLNRWPPGRTVEASLLPLVPTGGSSGKVDVAIGVRGLGAAHGALPTVGGSETLVRVGVVSVSGTIQ